MLSLGSYDPSVNPSQEDNVSWSPVSLEDSPSPMASTQTQRQLLPRPGTGVPEQIRPLPPVDSEDDQTAYIAINPKHLTLPLAPSTYLLSIIAVSKLSNQASQSTKS